MFGKSLATTYNFCYKFFIYYLFFFLDALTTHPSKYRKPLDNFIEKKVSFDLLYLLRVYVE